MELPDLSGLSIGAAGERRPQYDPRIYGDDYVPAPPPPPPPPPAALVLPWAEPPPLPDFDQLMLPNLNPLSHEMQRLDNYQQIVSSIEVARTWASTDGNQMRDAENDPSMLSTFTNNLTEIVGTLNLTIPDALTNAFEMALDRRDSLPAAMDLNMDSGELRIWIEAFYNVLLSQMYETYTAVRQRWRRLWGQSMAGPGSVRRVQFNERGPGDDSDSEEVDNFMVIGSAAQPYETQLIATGAVRPATPFILLVSVFVRGDRTPLPADDYTANDTTVSTIVLVQNVTARRTTPNQAIVNIYGSITERNDLRIKETAGVLMELKFDERHPGETMMTVQQQGAVPAGATQTYEVAWLMGSGLENLAGFMAYYGLRRFWRE